MTSEDTTGRLIDITVVGADEEDEDLEHLEAVASQRAEIEGSEQAVPARLDPFDDRLVYCNGHVELTPNLLAVVGGPRSGCTAAQIAGRADDSCFTSRRPLTVATTKGSEASTSARTAPWPQRWRRTGTDAGSAFLDLNGLRARNGLTNATYGAARPRSR